MRSKIPNAPFHHNRTFKMGTSALVGLYRDKNSSDTKDQRSIELEVYSTADRYPSAQ